MLEEKIKALQAAQIEYTEIVSVTFENAADLDANAGECRFCRVVCYSSYEEGSSVYTEVWLPEKWNGRFVSLGNGGRAGVIRLPSLLQYVQRGCAAAHTDMGTSGGAVGRGEHNPAVWRDFGWRSTHGMAVIGKALVQLHYGCAPAHSYYVGASTGGQQAFSAVQRFPQDYDGVVAGVPANNRVALHTYFLWNHNHLRTPTGEMLFTEAEIARITACATEFFQQKNDGCPGDRFVSYPWLGENTVAEFMEFLRREAFSENQRQALEAVYRGPVSPVTGKRIYNGMPIGSEMFGCGMWECQQEVSPHFYIFNWAFGKEYNGNDFDFDVDFVRAQEILSDDLDANKTDLRPFKAHGGKLLAFSGSADPCVPFPDALAYYRRVVDAMGGYEQTADFFRYFLFPGRDHGGGGLGSNRDWFAEDGSLDLFDAMCRWCEDGLAPESLTAARVEDGTTQFARKIYPCGSEQNPLQEGPPACEFC